MNSSRNASSLAGQAAVLIAVADAGHQQQLLLTKRAEHLTLHRGEVAFPGGKWEPGDEDLMATALRETREEVALKAAQIEMMGQLNTCYTLAGIAVTPWVGCIVGEPRLRANPDELDAIFWVPLDFFKRDQRERTDIFQRQRCEDWAPVYHYEGFTIWGFTARVIVEFLNTFHDAGIGRKNPAPEQLFSHP